MIKAKKLTKEYKNFKALKDISFEIEKGQVVGFLGPNGAGKTTTMRILTGYLPMTSGTATIDGLDVFEDSLKVREKIGYLPETTPLYQEMTVREYLDFVANLKKVDKEKKKEEIKAVAQKTNIEDRLDSIIKTLSKGYKQRVGIAQALIGDPEVIVLDEPTIGLDPNQILEIRELIKELGKSKTVILSTHIMQEVAATCDKVIIINDGKVIAIDTPENLTSAEGGEVHFELEVEGPAKEVTECVSGLEDIKEVKEVDSSSKTISLMVIAKKGKDPRAKITKAVVNNGWGFLKLQAKEADLEEVFRKLTKK